MERRKFLSCRRQKLPRNETKRMTRCGQQLFGQPGAPSGLTSARMAPGFAFEQPKHFQRFTFRHTFQSGCGFFGRHGFIDLRSWA